MPIYDVHGNPIDASAGRVYIANLKSQYSTYNDDQLLEAAISLAQSMGELTVIVWDGEDIHFSGQVTHVCSGFGGIDFNGSAIYMPNYDGGTIISIVPDSAEDITVSASDFFSTYTTNASLKGKVFRMNNRVSGNATMCLGTRTGAETPAVMYSSPCIRATPDGFFTTGELYLTPTSGDVVCYNVHECSNITFELCNATIVSYASANMSLFTECHRSNVHIHNFMLLGTSNIRSYHPGIFQINSCINIEIDNLFGVNPVQKALTSGYIFSLSCVSYAHVHDVNVGNRDNWGVMGNGFITNCTFERCYTNRWDNHFAQFGYNVIRDCTFNYAQYGIGNGSLVFENCTVLLSEDATNSTKWFIQLRADTVGVYDGDIIIRNCSFIPGKQSANKTGILLDSCSYAKPSNSAVSGAPKRGRYVSKCRIPDGCQYVFQIGTATTADQPMFANLTYAIEDTVVGSGTIKIHPLGSGQTVTEVQSSDYYGKLS